MCRTVVCRICGKTTWAGCGQHVDEVMRSVPGDERCKGHRGEAQAAGLLRRLFSRR